jgi:hypothetical protein
LFTEISPAKIYIYEMKSSRKFTAQIGIIGINPYVLVPADELARLFGQAGRSKGAVPVRMTIDGHEFGQTLVKYAGEWRLYLNGPMRRAAGKDVGDKAVFSVEFDPSDRRIPLHPKLKKALKHDRRAADGFDRLSPSLQKEIVRYFAHLKTDESIDRNIPKAMAFLRGEERFAGRDPKKT